MATRRTLDSIPPGWIEYEADLTPLRCGEGDEAWTAVADDPFRPQIGVRYEERQEVEYDNDTDGEYVRTWQVPVPIYSADPLPYDPAHVVAFCNAAWARDADYLAAMEIIAGIAPDAEVSRQCVNGVVELSVGVLDIAPIREAVGAVIPESRLKVF